MEESANKNQLTQQVETIIQRAVQLSQYACSQPLRPELLKEAFEELRISLEELQAVQEELIATREVVEAERQRYQDLFEFAPDGYLVTNMQGIIQEVNRAAAGLLHRSQQHLVGKPLTSFIPVTERRVFRTQLTQLSQADSAQDWQVRLQPGQEPHASQQFLDAALTVAVVRDADNQPIALRWLLRNITERKQAEELRQQAEREHLVTEIAQRIRQSLNLEEILNTTATEVRQFLQCDRVFVYRFQPDWSGIVVVESVGPGWQPLCGRILTDPNFVNYVQRYQQGRIQATADIYAADLTLCYVEFLAQQVQARAVLVVPILQGETLWGLLVANQCAAPRPWQQQEIDLLKQLATQVAIAIQQSELYQQAQAELAERQRVEEELKRQNLRSRLFAEIALKVRQSLNLEEILQTTVTEVQKFLQADRVLVFQLWPDGFGKVVKEAVVPGWPSTVGRGITDDCFGPEHLQQYRQGRIYIIDALDTAQVHSCLREFLQQFGVKAKLVVPILLKEDIWGLLIVHQCNSPRQWSRFEVALLQQLADQIGIALAQSQSLEAESRQRQELARSNAELEQFAYVASHDLQEPLRMVTSYLQLIERRYQNKLDADANEFIDYAVNGATRMQALINDLLTYSRVGTRGSQFQSTDATTVLKRAIANLQVAIQESGAVVTHDDPLPAVVADAVQLEQLLQNLISNAIKFRSQEPLAIHIRAERQDQAWLFSVQDNGIGINPQYAERIFLIFQRLHTRTEYSGTGIGLAVCKKIVERHGGRIWVKSQLGQGSTFHFTIPDRGVSSS